MSNFSTSDNEMQPYFKKWGESKLDNIKVHQSMSRIAGEVGISPMRLDRLERCSDVIAFGRCQCSGTVKVVKTNLCRDRFCPTCQKQRTKLFSKQAMQVLHALHEREGEQRYVFMTLTVKNCLGANLSATITDMQMAFKRLSKRITYMQAVKGHIKALEVTHNAVTNEYHPHLHVLAVVNENYFKEFYITNEQLVKEWQSSLKVDYAPIVDIRAVRTNKADDEIVAGALETVKYSIKTKDILHSDNVFITYIQAMRGKRCIAYAGILKALHKELNLADIEDENTNIDDDKHCACELCNSELALTVYRWSYGFKAYTY